jgi:hypothetical protein
VKQRAALDLVDEPARAVMAAKFEFAATGKRGLPRALIGAADGVELPQ